MSMVTLLLLSLFLVTLYVGVTIWKLRSLPESISAMVYVLPEGGWQWLWTIWLWVVSLLTCIPAIEALSPQGLEAFGFFTLVCFGLVGAMPLFLKEQIRWHYVLAIVGGILSQVCVLLVCHYFLILWMLMLWVLIDSIVPSLDEQKDNTPRWYDGKTVFLCEAVCYATTIGSILCYFMFL